MRKFGNRYYRKLGKTSDVYARRIAQNIRNRGVNARVVKNAKGSTVFVAPRKYNARLYHGDWNRGYSNIPGSRATDARFLTNQPIMAQYYASKEDREALEFSETLNRMIPSRIREGGGRLWVLENDNPPLDLNPQVFDGSSGIEYTDKQLEKFKTGPYAVGNVWLGATNDEANMIAGKRLAKHLDIDAFMKAYIDFGGGWGGMSIEQFNKMNDEMTDSEIAAYIITAMADDLDNVIILGDSSEKHFQIFQKAMLDAGLEYLVFRDVSPSTAFADGRYPNMSLKSDPMVFRRIPLEVENEMNPRAMGDYVQVENPDDQEIDPSITQFRIDDGSGRADVLKVVRVYEDENYLFAADPIGRRVIAKDLGIKPEQLLIYDNVWDGAKEVDF